MNRIIVLTVLLIGLLFTANIEARRLSRADFNALQDILMSDSEQSTMCTTAALNLRTSPCTNAQVLVTIPNGNQVAATGERQSGCGHTWAKVNFRGTVGWAATGYLTGCGGSSNTGSGGSISGYGTSYVASGYTFTGTKAQTLNLLKAKFGAHGTTYVGHSNGVYGSSDLWCPGAAYAKNNSGNSCMNQMADYIAANLSNLKLEYVIWKQRIYHVRAAYWRQMEDRGSITQNHYDHVHITFA